MRKIGSVIFLFASFLFWRGLTFAQKNTAAQKNTGNCATVIKDAEILYNLGKYDECLLSLKVALKDCNLSRTEKQEAWILISRLNLEQDKTSESDNALVQLLKVNANYKPNPGAYQEDFYTHLDRIQTRPKLSVGLNAGLNVPVYNNSQTYSVLNGLNYSAPYKSVPGFTTGLNFEYEFYTNLSLVTGLDFSLFNYKRNLSSSLSDYTIDYSESLNYLILPLYLKKQFGSKKLKPYIILGGDFNFLQKATADITASYSEVDFLTGLSDNFTNSISNIDQKVMRTSTFGGLTAGAGASYRIKNLVFQVDIRYTAGMNYFTNSSDRFDNEQLIYHYYYIDNAVTLNRIEMTASVNYIFLYDVRVRKE